MKINFKLIVFLFLNLIFNVGITACDKTNSTTSNTNKEFDADKINTVLLVDKIRPQIDVWKTTIKANGGIYPRREIFVSAEINGYQIANINVEVGSKVKKGEVLAIINSNLLQQELKAANAGVNAAEHNLADAKKTFSRAQKLFAEKLIPEFEFEKAQSAISSAQSQLEVMRSQQNNAKFRLEKALIRAPENGVISHKNVNIGMVVGVGIELFRIIADEQLEWRAEVSIDESVHISIGQKVLINVSDNKTIEGEVRKVSPTASRQNRTVIVFVNLPRDGEGGTIANMIISGSFLQGEIIGLNQSVLVVPHHTVYSSDGYYYVFVIEQDPQLIPYLKAKIRAQKVEIVARKNNLIAIKGINQNVAIVGSGVGFLRDGDFVAIKKEG